MHVLLFFWFVCIGVGRARIKGFVNLPNVLDSVTHILQQFINQVYYQMHSGMSVLFTTKKSSEKSRDFFQDRMAIPILFFLLS